LTGDGATKGKGALMLRGLATISFWADDLKAARAWYSELLGIAPYFERPDAENPAYIEFRLGSPTAVTPDGSRPQWSTRSATSWAS
jgi:hypothetical protein